MELDIIDEQLDTLGRAIMGLTLGCARCHDHKFDPISADDYYALAGIFKSTRTMEQYTKVARWWEHPIPTPDDRARQAAHEQELTAAKERIEQFVSEANRTAGDVPSLEDAAQENLEAAYPAGIKTRLKRLRDELAKLEENPPEISSAMGVGERAVRDLPVHIRGSHLAIGEPVPRRFPAVLVAGKQPIFDRQRSGRLRLAAWLTSEHHPLTCRVFVNRIWRWHFGRGLVATPDNFGNLGERPVNQPLLDWLAVRFRENAWSIKWLHRVILSSTTWRMSSRLDRRAAELDPENRLQWRSNMRRLEAEAIRDSILAVSGQLDRSMGGTLITLGNRAYFFDHTSKDTTEYRSNRRSIYLPVVRNHLYEMFSLFDYSDAGSVVGSRETSTVAPQALFMMNSDFVHRASEALAKQLCSQEQSDEARIRSLYRRVLCRDPAPHEVLSSLEFLGRAAADFDEPEAWPLLCQVVLSSNEFVYLR